MENQVLQTVWCNISGDASGEIWNWSLLGVKDLSWEYLWKQSSFGKPNIQLTELQVHD